MSKSPTTAKKPAAKKPAVGDALQMMHADAVCEALQTHVRDRRVVSKIIRQIADNAPSVAQAHYETVLRRRPVGAS